ncbi:PD40 domain-containing protein [Desulfotomaculum copahuensis]|uniref:Translocation protein TolB n=1 Tax=Desulfotomaculum copahuensis TaxID=1838280 RepID=A0A1B7LGC5_9FIRM|nr:PD40 domain-containing protein [Desulfotomaculum copahuensis]OAT85019.1 hypothetical protein A6M21_07295 [Desulfotomaculum copahuensis]
MCADSANNGKGPDKITPLDDHRNKWDNRGEDNPIQDEGSLGELLVHMRKVREAVPVNMRLREELKARLSRMQAADGAGLSPAAGEGADIHRPAAAGEGGFASPARKVFHPGWKSYWWLLPVVALLLLAGCWLYRSTLAPKILVAGPVNEISRFWLENHPLEFACAPGGRGYLAVRGGALILLDRYGNQTGMIKPPGGGSYASPALTRSGGQLALVRNRAGGGAEIITASMPAAPLEPNTLPEVKAALDKAVTMLQAGPGETLSGLAWSPDGKTLACTLGRPGGGEDVYLLAEGKKPVSPGAGGHPAWSPDGSHLVVERSGAGGQPELWLLAAGGGAARQLGPGRQPAWGPQGFLAFIGEKTVEQVLTYSPDGSPLFTVRQRQGEIRTIYLGAAGKPPSVRADEKSSPAGRLLLAPDGNPGAAGLNWLRQMESQGVREPRTLLLNQLDSFQDLHFSPGGNSLLVARRDGGMVSLVQVELQEKTSGRGEEN